MPLPFIAGMLIGAGAITAYNNKEKVIKCLKTGFATAKTSGENLVQIVKGDHICEPVCPDCGEKKSVNHECKSEICPDYSEKTDANCEHKADKAQNEAPKNVTTKKPTNQKEQSNVSFNHTPTVRSRHQRGTFRRNK